MEGRNSLSTLLRLIHSCIYFAMAPHRPDQLIPAKQETGLAASTFTKIQKKEGEQCPLPRAINLAKA
jgi:hypothetical protein